MDSDAVLVMGSGRCVEMGSPKELLATVGSHFRSLAIESKIDLSTDGDSSLLGL
jgi:ABC-type multidrug transport system fused ATPase/permease subunit